MCVCVVCCCCCAFIGRRTVAGLLMIWTRRTSSIPRRSSWYRTASSLSRRGSVALPDASGRAEAATIFRPPFLADHGEAKSSEEKKSEERTTTTTGTVWFVCWLYVIVMATLYVHEIKQKKKVQTLFFSITCLDGWIIYESFFCHRLESPPRVPVPATHAHL